MKIALEEDPGGLAFVETLTRKLGTTDDGVQL